MDGRVSFFGRRDQNFSPVPWAVRPRVPSARFVFGVNACSRNAPFFACIEGFSRLLSAFFARPFFCPPPLLAHSSLCILVGEFLGQKKKRGYLVPIYLRQKTAIPVIRFTRSPCGLSERQQIKNKRPIGFGCRHSLIGPLVLRFLSVCKFCVLFR